MADDLRRLAHDLCDFLVAYHRVTQVEGPRATSSDWRHWEIEFTYRGVRRHFIYHIERVDPETTMVQALRAESTGELMVRIPDEGRRGVLANTIYYPPHG
jgi:hypothetical protein